jgi:protein-tyrosine phosphatase
MTDRKDPSDGRAAPARILVVCTANIARSPLVEVLLDAHVRHRGLTAEVTVDSAGVHARPDQPAAEESRLLAAQAGMDLSRHRSRHVDEVDPDHADLVLTMSTRQRDHLGLLVPGLGPRVFTLPEAARLAAAVLADGADPLGRPGAARLREGVLAIHRQRPRSAPDADGDDVDDPYGLGEAAFLAMANRVASAAEPVTELLLGPARSR